jgi:hypothetical protein
VSLPAIVHTLAFLCVHTFCWCLSLVLCELWVLFLSVFGCPLTSTTNSHPIYTLPPYTASHYTLHNFTTSLNLLLLRDVLAYNVLGCARRLLLPYTFAMYFRSSLQCLRLALLPCSSMGFAGCAWESFPSRQCCTCLGFATLCRRAVVGMQLLKFSWHA